MSVHSLRPAALRCPGGFGRGFPGNAASSKGISSEFRAFWALLSAIIAGLAGPYSKTIGAFGTSTTIHILIFSTTRAQPRPAEGRLPFFHPPPRGFAETARAASRGSEVLDRRRYAGEVDLHLPNRADQSSPDLRHDRARESYRYWPSS